MENESPNLFDSEPVITRIVAEENHDDVLTELIEEIRDEVTHDVGDENDGADDRSSIEQRDDEHPEPKTKDVVHKGLPPGRVKLIMKMDPDVNIVATDAVFVLTKATESFVGLLAQHCLKEMESSNKKTLQKKHIDAVIGENIPFEFLEGALDW